MAKDKTIANFHTRNYISTVFEKRLREEGFTCPDDKLLCWYRIKNNCVVNSIIFFSSWPNVPVWLEIGYGIHPLFAKPVYTPSVYFSSRPRDEERFQEQAIVENCSFGETGYKKYSNDIFVLAPGRDGRGSYTFDGVILPQMESVRTVDQAYEFHKRRRLNCATADSQGSEYKLRELSCTFVDMAIFSDDTEVYPDCKKNTIDAINLYERFCSRFPNNAAYRNELQHWNMIQAALFDGGRREYLSFLKQQENTNISYLKNKLHVPF
jgi:hypothetical protein